MDADTVRQYINDNIYTNNRREITADMLKAVLQDMLTLQETNDASHEDAISGLEETLSYLEIQELLNL